MSMPHLPEPYRSMSPTDPRRREYEARVMPASGATATTPEGAAWQAWQSGDTVFFAAQAVATTSSLLDVDKPSLLNTTDSPAQLIEAIERIGWKLDSINYAHGEGTSTPFAAGVRLSQGTIFAMMLFRRPLS